MTEYVALHVRANGIHPASARVLTIDAVTFDDAGRIGETFHQVFNPGADPGPRHTHGLEPSDFARAPRFSRHLRTLDKLIDGRVLTLYDSPLAWGLIVSEAKRAMNAAARANRSRRGQGNRRRQRVGHVPKPSAIVDLLATARRQGHTPTDARLPAVADLIGVAVPPAPAGGAPAGVPGASGAAGTDPAADAALRTMIAMFLQLRESGDLVTLDPEELAADRFGLQRTQLRVDAAKAAAAGGAAAGSAATDTHAPGAPVDTPGVYSPAAGLQAGMEFAVTDDVQVCPDELIDLGVRAGLTYSEKLSRETSLVVSEAQAKGVELRGKAMHAHRKDIPILTAHDFRRAVQRMGAGAE